MATRARKKWNPGKDGRYARQIGWKHSSSGKLVQAKFRLGSDLGEARRRDRILGELWGYVEGAARGETVVWPDDVLEVAQQVAREGHPYFKKREGESPDEYFKRYTALKIQLPFLAFHPRDASVFQQCFQAFTDRLHLVQKETEEAADSLRYVLEPVAAEKSAEGGPALHEAMRAHIEWLKQEYRDPDVEITGWGRMRIKQVRILLERHEDRPLVQIGHDEIERMIRYWRQRPNKKGTNEPITKKSAENLIAALKNFFRWLGRSEKYDWKKPEDFEEIRSRVDPRAGDVRPQVMPDDVFTLDELVLLDQYATPLERTLLLLGVNCGFGRAEIASLLVDEVHLFEAHEPRHQEILGFPSSREDSFIKRYRRKTGVYGEFILFPQTVQAIQWALERRKKQRDFGPSSRLLLNDRGESYDRPTAGGNPNQQIPNRFADLIKRIERDGKQIKKHPFKILRKTAGDLIRRFSDGEVAAVFQCRGQPVEIDDLADVYTNRPFGKVFEAIRQVQDYLQPMFDAAGSAPFKAQPQSYTPRTTIDRILELRHSGVPVVEIASSVKKHPSTVYRQIRRAEEPGT